MSQPPKPTTDAPYSEEAEEAVIGAVLYNPDAGIDVYTTLKADDFFLLRHQYIWQAILTLRKRDIPVDYLTLFQELKTTGQLETIGGAPYLTRLVSNTPTTSNLSFYADMVKRIATRRNLLTAADEIKASALNETLDVDQVQIDALNRLMKIAEDADRDNPVVSLAQALTEHFDIVEKAFTNPDDFSGVTSCIPEINYMMNGGYWNTELVIYAARPGMGKSSALMTEAFHAARTGKRVALFTLEMPTRDIVSALMAAEADIPTPRRMLRGKLSKDEYSRYVTQAGQIGKQAGNNLFIDDTPALTPMRLRTKCKLLKARYGLDAVYVDYLQLLSGGKEGDYWNRQQEIGFITRSLKRLAKELDIPVIAACQISRVVEGRQDKRPTLDSLRESGDIENDANVVLGMYLDDYYTRPNPRPQLSLLEIIPLKARDADTSGVVEAWFEGAKKRILPKAKDTQGKAG